MTADLQLYIGVAIVLCSGLTLIAILFYVLARDSSRDDESQGIETDEKDYE